MSVERTSDARGSDLADFRTDLDPECQDEVEALTEAHSESRETE